MITSTTPPSPANRHPLFLPSCFRRLARLAARIPYREPSVDHKLSPPRLRPAPPYLSLRILSCVSRMENVACILHLSHP